LKTSNSTTSVLLNGSGIVVLCSLMIPAFFHTLLPTACLIGAALTQAWSSATRKHDAERPCRGVAVIGVWTTAVAATLLGMAVRAGTHGGALLVMLAWMVCLAFLTCGLSNTEVLHRAIEDVQREEPLIRGARIAVEAVPQWQPIMAYGLIMFTGSMSHLFLS